MGFGRFALYFKSALMLQSKRDMDMISVSNFHAFKKDARERISRALKAGADQFLQKDVKDYRDVVKNLAMSLMRR